MRLSDTPEKNNELYRNEQQKTSYERKFSAKPPQKNHNNNTFTANDDTN